MSTTQLSGSSSIGPLRSQMSGGSSTRSSPPSSTSLPPTAPYLDVMSVRNTHVPRDGLEEVRKLIFDPVLIPDLEHTGVRPSMDLEDRLLFYPSGCKNCNLQLNIQGTLRSAEVAGAGSADEEGGATGGGGGRAVARGREGVAGGKANIPPVRLKVQKQPPNKVTLAPYAGKPAMEGLGGGSSSSSNNNSNSNSNNNHHHHKGDFVAIPALSTPRNIEGRYDLNGVKTLRKKPTSDKEAKRLVKSLQSTAHQMSLLVFNEV